MAWEKRGNRRYYYRKRREGRRVRSEYLGAGEWATVFAAADAHARMEARLKRQAERLELSRWMALHNDIDEILDLCSDLTNAALILVGFHTHKGTWRCKREKRYDQG